MFVSVLPNLKFLGLEQTKVRHCGTADRDDKTMGIKRETREGCESGLFVVILIREIDHLVSENYILVGKIIFWSRKITY